MRRSLLWGLSASAQLVWLTTLAAQDPRPDWRLEGLRRGFCVQLLLDSSSDAVQDLPPGYRPLAASQVKDLHISLRSVMEGQREFESWSPSRLCFYAVDTLHAKEFSLADRSGRRPQLFAVWTVSAVAPDGAMRDVVLELYGSSERLMRSARLAGQGMREARLRMGKVTDEDGVAGLDERIEVRIGKTTITWDGRLAGEITRAREPVMVSWASVGPKDRTVTGNIRLQPIQARAMAGALKIDGKDDLAKALRASPSRFAGPALVGGRATVTFGR